MRKITAAAIAIAFTASGTSALAHGIWIAQRHDDWAVVYGHGASDEGYDPAKLEAVAAFAAVASRSRRASALRTTTCCWTWPTAPQR